MLSVLWFCMSAVLLDMLLLWILHLAHQFAVCCASSVSHGLARPAVLQDLLLPWISFCSSCFVGGFGASWFACLLSRWTCFCYGALTPCTNSQPGAHHQCDMALQVVLFAGFAVALCPFCSLPRPLSHGFARSAVLQDLLFLWSHCLNCLRTLDLLLVPPRSKTWQWPGAAPGD